MLPGHSGYVQNIDRNPFTITAQKIYLQNLKVSGFKYTGQYGGVFSVQVHRQFTDQGSRYFQNEGAYHGGVFYFRGYIKKYSFINSTFEQNQASSGGALYAIQETEIDLAGCTFTRNSAEQRGGAILVSESAFFTIVNSQFTENKALQEGSAIYTINSAGSFDKSTLEDSLLERNGQLDSGGSSIFSIFCEMELNSNTFLNNRAGRGTKGVKAILSQVTLTRNLFEDSITQTDIRLASSFVLLGDSTQADLHSNIFQGATTNAPALLISGDAEVEVRNCTFFNNTHKNFAAIEASGFRKLIIEDSLFESNSGSPVADLSILKSEKKATISNCSFIRSLDGDSVYISDAKAQIQGCSFKHRDYNSSFDSGRQNSIYCDNCEQLVVNGSNFKDLEVDHALRLSYANLKRGYYSLVTNCSFSQINFLKNGGAIALQNYNLVSIHNNTFSGIENENLDGAGIFISGRSAQDIKISGNLFQKNKARLGGGFAYTFQEPQNQENEFTDNYARQYGADKAGYPSNLVLLSKKTYLQVKSKQTHTVAQYQTEMQIDHHRSGDLLPQFYLAVVDRYGQITTTVSQKLVFEIHVKQSQYMPVVSAVKQILPDQGIYKVEQIKVITEPGVSSIVTIKSENTFDYELPDVKDSMKGDSVTFTLLISTDLCQPGYAFNINGQCSYCEPGTYSFQQPLHPNHCLQCPLQAECFGGTQIAPLPSFWRANAFSLKFYNCFNPAACLGSTLQNYNPQGECTQGYNGVLCSQCEHGMTSNGSFECGRCPSHGQNMLIIFVSCIIAVVLVILVIKVTFSGIDHKNNSCSIYLKIMMNHLQLIYLVSTFDLSWPQEVQTFQASAQPVANISQRIVSFDCFLQSTVTTRPFYFKLLLNLLSPLVIGFVVCLFWCIILRHQNRVRLWSKSVACLTIILFIIHPSLTSTIFQAFL